MRTAPPRRSASPRLAALLAGLTIACGPGKADSTEGSAGESTAGSATGSEATAAEPTTGGLDTSVGTESGSDGGGPGTGSDESGGPAEFCAPGPTPIRRLTRAQYENSLRDILVGVKLPSVELPPDGSREGFENLADTQPPLDPAMYAAAAKQIAAAAAAQGGPFLFCPPDGGDNPDSCGQQSLALLQVRLFRGIVTNDEMVGLSEGFASDLAQDGFTVALENAIASLLSAEGFLLLREPFGTPVEGQPGVVKLQGFELAARMSYFLWNTTPDDELMEAANADELDDLAGIDAQLDRMLADPRARAAVAHMDEQWLYMHHLAGGEDEDIPSALRASMREEAARLFAHVVFDGEHTLASLLTTPMAFPDAALADLYEVGAPAQDFAATQLDPARRPGVLTRAGWLTIGGRKGRYSPFMRGLRLLDSLFCLEFPPPPPDVSTELPDPLPPDATTRDLYDTILAEPQCASCHLPAHMLGYGFEHLGVLGVWQDVENGTPVDARGEVLASGADISGEFDGAAELTQMLAGSRSVHDCTARKHYMYGLGRLLGEADDCGLTALQAEFFAGGGDLQALLRAIVRSDGFRHRREP